LGNGVSIKFILIPAGRFMMGSPGSQHEVTIAKPYYVAVYKVTQAQYAQVTGDNPSTVKGKNFPVSDVTWKDAVDFCQKASQRAGKTIHLPSEAQWENACRAGANTNSSGATTSASGETTAGTVRTWAAECALWA
jgi:formylglycine-generating enzyme required for sulfatase activity